MGSYLWVYPQALAYIPIMTAAILSPIWTQVGGRADQIRHTHAELQKTKEERKIKRALWDAQGTVMSKNKTRYFRTLSWVMFGAWFFHIVWWLIYFCDMRLILTVFGFALLVLQFFCALTGRGGADLMVNIGKDSKNEIDHDPFRRVGHAREVKAQWTLSIIVFLIWFILNVIPFQRALDVRFSMSRSQLWVRS
ncbi:hypothetical protein RQP46_006286 [Phenoliferia psychrophenolica]